MIYVLWLLSLCFLYYFLESRKKTRVNEFMNLIDNMKNQKYKIPMKQDNFSIFEGKNINYIYAFFYRKFEIILSQR